ncbi:hypothetical protein KW783_01320 [Candidatus Parcubacteria bacterium]|nr:hypothetical protein [Candidatus Parcubacteria bacterium]
MATKFTITNGPSKWDLMLSLFDGSSDHRRQVSFTVLPDDDPTGAKIIIDQIAKERGREPTQGYSPEQVAMVMNRLEREDGSGDCWNFVGNSSEDGRYGRYRTVRGFYSTATRKGFLESF